VARRLAIRAAKFDPKPTLPFQQQEKTKRRNVSTEKDEGPLRGQ
jgi:hypothetical protein